MFIAISDFGARKKKITWSLTLLVQFSPPHPGKGQIPHSPGTRSSQMPAVCPGGGMLKFRFDRRISTANWLLSLTMSGEDERSVFLNTFLGVSWWTLVRTKRIAVSGTRLAIKDMRLNTGIAPSHFLVLYWCTNLSPRATPNQWQPYDLPTYLPTYLPTKRQTRGSAGMPIPLWYRRRLRETASPGNENEERLVMKKGPMRTSKLKKAPI